jgi:hypothetical protein
MATSKEVLTAEEERNLKLVKEWAESWRKDAGRMVDQIYADKPEVFLPQQGLFMTRAGKSKADWKAVEVANQNLYKARKMELLTVIPRGNVVAVEVLTTETNLIDRTDQRRFAAFLTFGKDGRVVSDHTYMLNPERTPDPERAHTPEIKKRMLAMRKAHQRVMAKQ